METDCKDISAANLQAVSLHPVDLGEKHLIHFQCDFKHNYTNLIETESETCRM